MRPKLSIRSVPTLAVAAWLATMVLSPAQTPARVEGQPPGGGPGFGGPPPFGPGGMVGGETKLVDRFDLDEDGWLNAVEREAARGFLKQERESDTGRGGVGPRGGRRGRPPGGGFPGRDENEAPPEPGARLSPDEVEIYRGRGLYDPRTLRTLFMEFESADWEEELADFNNTDVDVPAHITVDGKTYEDVGVHFRGMSSYMMVPEGRKRSLNLSFDAVHGKQDIDGYNTLNLLNAHEDPTFMRTVLALDIAREYLPAPKANFVRVVINGESWGVYVNAQQFNKDFLKEWWDTKKGDRWKVTGSPMGRGGLNYLGDDVADYERVFEMKSKEDPEAWEALIALCKALDTTPAEQLEQALEPLLDIDGTLRFLAWDNVLANADGYWVRASDYNLYRDESGRFHLIPHDANETFSMGGGPGGRGGPGGPRGPGAFGPGMFVAPQIIAAGDQDGDGRLTREEFGVLAVRWFEQMKADYSDDVTLERFMTRLGELMSVPEGGPGGFGPPGDRGHGRGAGPFGPARFLGPGLYAMLDLDQDGALVRSELETMFAQWFAQWDKDGTGMLDEAMVSQGITASLPAPQWGGPGGGGIAGPPGSRNPEGPGRGPGRMGGPSFGGPAGGGVELDPLVAVNDPSKPLLSKLLAVPSLRAKYLAYVRDMAETWLDWNRLGPRVQEYQLLIEADVKADTRKLDSYEEFLRGVSAEAMPANDRRGSLRGFAEQRREYLLRVTAP